jgi:mRNA-degrading endonuclease RelE of RelBE toxin-antitoxin system
MPERSGEAPESPARNGETIRHLLYGSRPNVYRVLFTVDDRKKTVFVLTVRHGRQATATDL